MRALLVAVLGASVLATSLLAQEPGGFQPKLAGEFNVCVENNQYGVADAIANPLAK